MSVGALAAQGRAILAAAEAGLVASTTGHAAPAHVFLSHGPPNLELCCDGELAVWLENVNHDPVNGTGIEGGCDPAENYAVWVVGLYRCWPSDTPTADGYDDAATDLLVDAWALLTQFYDENRTGALITGCDCEQVRLGHLTPSEAEGGCAGWEFRLTIDLSCLSDTGS